MKLFSAEAILMRCSGDLKVYSARAARDASTRFLGADLLAEVMKPLRISVPVTEEALI